MRAAIHFARLLAIMLPLLAGGAAQAHKPSDSYLTLRIVAQTGAPGAAADRTLAVDGRWDIALRDLDFAIGLDADDDGRLTWDEVRARHGEIAAYALAGLGVAPGCQLHATSQQVGRHSDGAYTVLLLRGECRPGAAFGIDYRLFADLDAQHRGMANIAVDGRTRSVILGGGQTRYVLGADGDSVWQQGATYLRHGVWHIWTGYDHMLFLLSLLLPAVLVVNWRPATGDVLRVVTAFTLAHSITLTLAVLQVLTLPSRWIESAIAATVAVAALNNIWPIVRGKRWLAAFAFGLVHGFGFAGVLGELGLPKEARMLALAAFNIGVELGQLAIVAAFVPLAYAMRRTWLYRQLMVKGGSACIAVLALVWLAERATV